MQFITCIVARKYWRRLFASVGIYYIIIIIPQQQNGKDKTRVRFLANNSDSDAYRRDSDRKFNRDIWGMTC